MKTAIKLAAFVVLMMLAGCGRKDVLAPPTIHYGQDLCAECGMILSDERFAVATVGTDDGDAKLFDDLGCYLTYRAKHPEASGKVLYVHDMATRQWLTADQAAYVHSAALQTPMGSGLAAAAPAGAARLQQQYNGARMDFSQLLHQRQATTRPQ